MLITMGLPIFFLELAVGQYSGLGPNEAFKRMAPALEGLGYCTLVVILLVMVYYMVIVAWTLFYTFLSFLPKLSWAYCDNDFNTNRKYTDKITNRPSPFSRVLNFRKRPSLPPPPLPSTRAAPVQLVI